MPHLPIAPSLSIFSECGGKLDTTMKFLYVSPRNQREALVTDYIRSKQKFIRFVTFNWYFGIPIFVCS